MNKHPERPGCAPCLSSPCPWSSVSRNDGEPKWPRLPPLASPRSLSIRCASRSPRIKLPICRWTDQCGRTDGACRRCVSAQLDRTTAAHTESEQGREGAMVAASSVSRMARRAAEPHFHNQTFFSISPCTFTIHAFVFVRKESTNSYQKQPPRVAEYPAETTGILSAQDNNKNGAQLAVPPDVQY